MNRQYLETIGLTDEQAAEVQHLFDLERLKVRVLAEALARCRRCRFYCRRRRRHPPHLYQIWRGGAHAGRGSLFYLRGIFWKKESRENQGQ